ncbi:MAG TPA: nuclear transport factor 2 family protein [Gemmatimonadales bacterium]
MNALLVAVLLVLQAQDADSRALLTLEDRWAVALVKRDRAAFERMLAPKFVYTENAQLSDRAAVLTSLAGDTVTAAHNDSMVVHRYGAVTAVVTGWLVVEGRDYVHRYRFTDTWVKRSGRWQIVAAQDYLMP